MASAGSTLVALRIRTSTLVGRAEEPIGRDFLRLDRAEELALERERHRADLVEEQRAAVGGVEEALFVARGAGEGALGVSEKLALQERIRQRGAVDGDQPPVLPVAHAMDGARDHLLAGPALAQDQDVAVGRGDAVNQVAHLLHRRALADDAARLVPRAELFLERLMVALQGHVLQQPLDPQQDVVEKERLGQVVVRAELDRLDGRLDIAVGADHDEMHLRGGLAAFPQEVESAHVGEPQIADREVEIPLLELEQGLGGGAAAADRVALLGEDLAEHVAERRFVVNDQNLRLSHRSLLRVRGAVWRPRTWTLFPSRSGPGSSRHVSG